MGIVRTLGNAPTDSRQALKDIVITDSGAKTVGRPYGVAKTGCR
jgi:hypothetical protein